jgi:hypothetical protein
MTTPTSAELVERVREGLAEAPPHDHDHLAYEALHALAVRLERAERERDGEGSVPTKAGGPGHEEKYWLKHKLYASIRHLRDVEDYYRLKGGLREGFNLIRADRARSIYEQITEDFLNGKRDVPTMRERAKRAEVWAKAERAGRKKERTRADRAEAEVARLEEKP